MPLLPVPDRRDEPELMDAPGLDPAEVALAYRLLGKINRQFFGSLGSAGRELDEAVRVDGPPGTLLDVGTGSGDIPEALRGRLARRGIRTTALALDRDPTALALAAARGLPCIRADALRLPFADASIDLVLAAKFAHHFDGPALRRLVAEMARVARRRVVVVDIRRGWPAYYAFIAWSRLFAPSRLVRHDGALSVLRGFTAAELRAAAPPAAEYRWEVRRHPGFQLALIGRRLEDPKDGVPTPPEDKRQKLAGKENTKLNITTPISSLFAHPKGTSEIQLEPQPE